MSRNQLIFPQVTKGQTYGLQGDFEPRQWHSECRAHYRAMLDDWRKSHADKEDRPQLRYCIYAGTGSGKTQAAGQIAAILLNAKDVDQVVVVSPNRSIRRKTQSVLRRDFGIDLVAFHSRKHADGIPRTKQGYLLTYSHLIQDPTLHRRICSPSTLVIFDEVHHLGDKNGWGESAVEAFGKVWFVLSLTGTPYRSDNAMIPFVNYEETPKHGILRFKPDFVYTLGKAVDQGICRKPLIKYHDATVLVRNASTPDAAPRELRFDKKHNDFDASHLLRGAVRYGSPGRRAMLEESLAKCRAEGRKVIIFLGGDTEADDKPTVDATEFLPSELRELGIGSDEYEVVTGDDRKAHDKIETFGASEKWILISINMVSEGVDIPELSAAIFLTSVTAKQTTYQRIGRVLRAAAVGESHPAALIFMFQDQNLVSLGMEIEAEIEAEVKLRKSRQSDVGNEGGNPDLQVRTESVCINGGHLTFVMFGGKRYPAVAVQEAERLRKANGLPESLTGSILQVMMEVRNGHAG